MTVITAGTYDDVISTASYDWQVDGVSKGASYTPVESDRTKTITVVETATSLLGGIGTAVAMGKTCRRTEPTVGYNFGKLTPVRSGASHYGKVLIKNLMVAKDRPLLGEGVPAPITWTVGAATSGTDAHWWRNSVTGDGYTPCKQAAISGDYVFPMTATFTDSVVETQTLTITAKDNVATAGSNDATALSSTTSTAYWNAVDINADGFGNGGTIEFALGSDWTTTVVDLRAHTFTNRVTYAYAHLDRIPLREKFSTLRARSLVNFKFQSIRTYNRTTISGGRLHFTSDGNSPTVPCSNFLIDDYQHQGDEASFLTANCIGTDSTQSAFGCLYLDFVDNFTVTGTRISWCATGVATSRTSNGVIRDTIVEYFCNNGIEYGSAGTNGLDFYDTLICRPWFHPSYQSLHPDAIQGSDSAYGGYVRFHRTMTVQGGGNKNMQAHFQGANTTGAGQYMNVEQHGFIATTRGGHAMSVSRVNNSVFEYFAILKHLGTDYPAGSTSDYPALPADTPPQSWIGRTTTANDANRVNGTTVVRKGFIQGTITIYSGTGPQSVVVDPDVYTFNQTWAANGTPLASLSGLTSQMVNGDPRLFIENITDTDWRAMTHDELRSTYMAAICALPATNLAAVSPVNAAGTDWNATLLAL